MTSTKKHLHDNIALFQARSFFEGFPVDILPYVAIGITLGIVAYFIMPFSLFLFNGMLGILLICFYHIREHLIFYILFMLAISGFAGYGLSHYYHQYHYRSDLLQKQIIYKEYKAEIISVIDRGQKRYFYVHFLEHAPIDYARIRAPKESDYIYPDDIIQAKFSLFPPPKPYFKGDYDFSFYAYTNRIQATGNVTQIDILDRPDWSYKQYIQKIRIHIKEVIEAHITAPESAIIIAMVTGNRSELSEETDTLWKKTGIFHLLSISGLHMTVIAGLVFFVCRRMILLLPAISEYYDTKKIAAFFAIIISFFYMILSGGSVPALRAFITVSVVLCAILLERKVISIRNAIIAYCLILCLNPAQIFNIGFLLSFAAVIGILLAVTIIQEFTHKSADEDVVDTSFLQKIFYFLMVNMAASYSGLPISIYAFGSIASYGALANLFAVPFTSFILMPLLVLSIFLMPFGLEAWPLYCVQKALNLIQNWAEIILSIQPEAFIVKAPTPIILGIFYLSLFLLIVLKKSARFIGGVGLVVTGILYMLTPKIDILKIDRHHIIAFKEHTGHMRFLTKDLHFRPRRYLFERTSQALRISKEKDYYITYCTRENTSIFKTISGKEVRCDMLGRQYSHLDL